MRSRRSAPADPGHPFLFMLALGTMAAALYEGELAVAAFAAAAVVWTVVH